MIVSDFTNIPKEYTTNDKVHKGGKQVDESFNVKRSPLPIDYCESRDITNAFPNLNYTSLKVCGRLIRAEIQYKNV